MSGEYFLLLVTVIVAAQVGMGLHLIRTKRNPWAGRRLLGMPVRGSDLSLAQIRRMGFFFLIFAPLFWLLIAAMTFGLLGPVDGIEPIRDLPWRTA
ncbi:MAG: hypothetical protein ACK4SZ_02095 [Allosphingosinicella sp.]|uniref:hypothetical protein n=1 Tax=Allosphingosinicella sp. TaxID=2823234 RepID=UPI0039442C6E